MAEGQTRPLVRAIRGRPLIGATLSVAALTAIARINGGLREVLIARDFGTSQALEAFLVGFAVVTIIVVALGGAMSSALVPTYFREGRSSNRASELVGSLLPSLLGLLALLSLVVAIGSPALAKVAGGGFDPSTSADLRRVIVVLSPVVLVGGLSAFFVAIVNAQERFALGATPQLVNPVVTVLILVLTPNPTSLTLACAFLLGAVGELVTSAGIAAGVGLRPVRPARNDQREDRSEFYAILWPITVALGFQASSTVVDQAVASHLPPGQVAILAFGSRIPGFVSAVGITAVGTVVLPQFSRLMAEGDMASLRGSLRSKTWILFLVGCAVAIPLSLMSVPVLGAVFGRGEFSDADVLAAAQVQAVAIWQLPFALLAAMYLRLLSAQQRQREVLVISIAGAVVNLMLSVIAARYWGTSGIAGATAAVFAFMVAAYRAVAVRAISLTETRHLSGRELQ